MKRKSLATEILILGFSLIFLLPILILATGSFMGEDELSVYFCAVLGKGSGYISYPFLPEYPTLRAYVEVLLDTPEFFVMFWNTVKLTLGTLAGQLIVGTLAAWGFARYAFPLKRVLLWLYILLMLMPFQVFMLSDYLALSQLGLLDKLTGIILLSSFSTLPVFIMQRFFSGIPDALLEAARLDGAGELQLFFAIGIPLGKQGIFSAAVLGFLESWSMIEQPLTFLKTRAKWPLSILLPEITEGRVGFAFAVSVLTFLPALLVFLFGQEYLEQGIMSSAIKE